jgi:hypothetical protein
LPKDLGPQTTQAKPLDKVDIVIQVVQEGSKLGPHGNAPWLGHGPFKYGPDRVVAYKIGAKEARDQAELRARLAVLHAATPERAVTIDARANAVYDDLVTVLDCAVEAGFTDITFKGARSLRHE